MALNVIIRDKAVRDMMRRALDEATGKRKCVPVDRFLVWKRARLDLIWQAKGMSESGARGTWAPNAVSTTIQKFRIGYDDPTPSENGVMRKKRRDVPMSLRRAKILEKTGALRHAVTVGQSKRDNGRQLVIKAPGLGKYPYYMLNGFSGTIRYVRRFWSKRWPNGRGKGKRPYLTLQERPVSAFIEYPARPWGVWLISDQRVLANELEKHFAGLAK